MPLIATLVASIAGPALGAYLNKSSQGSRNNEINGLIQSWMQQAGLGTQAAFGTENDGQGGIYGPMFNLIRQNMDRTNQGLYGNEQDPYGVIGNFQNGSNRAYDPSGLLQTIMGGSFDPYGQSIPGVQDNISQMGGLTGALGGQADLARQVFAGGGWTPQSQMSFDQLRAGMTGQNQQQQGMQNVANNIFGSNGQSQNPLAQSFINAASKGITGSNPDLDYAMGGARDIFSHQGQTGPTNQGIGQALGMSENGGMTPALQNLMGMGFNVLGNNGLTPNGAQGENSALGILGAGGANATTDFLQGRGADLASRESLLPMNLVASMARNRSATDYSNNMQAAQRQALARGGGPGATVANGLQNAGMAEYADKGAELESKAVQDALVQQQGLQLQQANMGANMAEQGGGLQNARYGTAGGLLSNLENTAANRFGIGGNFITGGTNAATSRAGTGLGALDQLAGLQSGRQMGALGQMSGISQTGINQANVFGNLGLGSMGQDLSAMGLGSQMSNSILQNMLGSNNAYNDLIGTQGRYALGAGALGNQGSTDISSILQAMMGGNLSASGQGLARTGQFYDRTQQGLTNQNDLMKFLGGQQNSNLGYGGNLLSQLLLMSQGSLQGASRFYEPRSSTAENPFAGIVSSFLQQAAGKIPKGGGGGGSYDYGGEYTPMP